MAPSFCLFTAPHFYLTKVGKNKLTTGGRTNFASNKEGGDLYCSYMPWVKLYPPGPSASLIERGSYLSGWVQVNEDNLLVEGPAEAPVMKAMLPIIHNEPGIWWLLFEVQEYSVVNPSRTVVATVGGA